MATESERFAREIPLTLRERRSILLMSGFTAVARRPQGILPKHCKSSRSPGRELAVECIYSKTRIPRRHGANHVRSYVIRFSP
jgi:hypothetical protein